jgi:hypothetical protein
MYFWEHWVSKTTTTTTKYFLAIWRAGGGGCRNFYEVNLGSTASDSAEWPQCMQIAPPTYLIIVWMFGGKSWAAEMYERRKSWEIPHGGNLFAPDNEVKTQICFRFRCRLIKSLPLNFRQAIGWRRVQPVDRETGWPDWTGNRVTRLDKETGWPDWTEDRVTRLGRIFAYWATVFFE